jgi:translation initiation factor IF-1
MSASGRSHIFLLLGNGMSIMGYLEGKTTKDNINIKTNAY